MNDLMSPPSLPNPYLLWSASETGRLYGRELRLRSILRTISNPSELRPVRFAGLPEIGKTSLLYHLCQPQTLEAHKDVLLGPFKNQPERLIFILVRFGPTRDKHPLVYMYQRLLEEYASGSSSAREWRLADDKPTTRPATIILRLEQNARELAKQGYRLVFVLDDYDIAFTQMDWGETTHLSPLAPLIAFVFAGRIPLQVANPKAASSPFFTKMDPYLLGGLGDENLPMSQKFARDLVEGVAEGYTQKLPEKDIAIVLESAGNHPHLLVRAAGVLWDLRERLGLLDKPGTELNAQLAGLLRTRIRANFSSSFQAYWEWIVPENYRESWDEHWGWAKRKMPYESARALMVALAFKKPLTPAETDELDPLWRAGLLSRGVTDEFSIFSPLFRDYLLQIYQNSDDLTAGETSNNQGHQETGEATPNVIVDNQTVQSFGGVGSKIYAFMSQRRGVVCTFSELERAAWGCERDNDPEHTALQTRISYLNKQLRQSTGEEIKSKRGIGYQLLPQGVRKESPKG